MAARGLDIDDIDVVIQLGCRQIDSFVHRSGRTGRAGKSGENILFFTKDDYPFLQAIQQEVNVEIEVTTDIANVDASVHNSKLVKHFSYKASGFKGDVVD